MHQLRHGGQLRAQFAAGMKGAELIGLEITLLHQGHGQRIPQGQRQRGGCGGGHAHRAGLGGGGQQELVIGRCHQRAAGAGRNPHQGDREPPRMGQHIAQLLGFAGIGDQDADILGGDHAQIAMAGLGWVDKMRGRTGRGKGGGHFARDVAGFAHAGNDHPSGGIQQGVNRAVKAVVQIGGQLAEPILFHRNHAAGDILKTCHEWAKMSVSGQPAKSSLARVGRKSKQACAISVRSSRASRLFSS